MLNKYICFSPVSLSFASLIYKASAREGDDKRFFGIYVIEYLELYL